MKGFKPLLDSCTETLGQIDEPSEDELERSDNTMRVEFLDGDVEMVDAIGINGLDEYPTIKGFDWVQYDTEMINQALAELDASVSKDERREIAELEDEIILMQRFTAPFEQVRIARMDDGGLFL